METRRRKSDTIPRSTADDRPAQPTAIDLQRDPGFDEPGSEPNDAVARRAYELYVEHGCEDGRDLENWLQAEREVLGVKA